ncbi:MAG: hypothetical protein M1829_002910 [Trizodia sp. TS-e1964]|nr:MAG: hypothetical protein M1829_002910 [Trizodia sp. TS-e1964]
MPKSFATNKVKVAYCGLFLSEFKTSIRSTYLAVNTIALAKAKLRKLRQKSSVVKYLKEFKNLCLVSSIEDKNAKEIIFWYGLKDSIKDKLSHYPVDISGFIAIKKACLTLDSKTRIYEMEKLTISISNTNSLSQNNSSNKNNKSSFGNKNKGSTEKRGPLTQAEKDFSCKNGQCL